MAKTLRTQYIDSSTIEPLVASRLIPLDKGEGAVMPIGEVIRRICGKCVMNIAKRDVAEANGSLQLCKSDSSHFENSPSFQISWTYSDVFQINEKFIHNCPPC